MVKKTFRKKILKPRKRSVKYVIEKDLQISYKDVDLIRKYLTDRGKIISRRLSGVTAQQQRQISNAIKRARYLGLLPVGAAKRK